MSGREEVGFDWHGGLVLLICGACAMSIGLWLPGLGSLYGHPQAWTEGVFVGYGFLMTIFGIAILGLLWLRRGLRRHAPRAIAVEDPNTRSSYAYAPPKGGNN